VTAQRTTEAERPSNSGVVPDLNREWAGLVDEHRDLGGRWSGYDPLRAQSDLSAVLVAARDHPDSVLGALLDAASEGDQLASRVVLQAMLGRVVCMSARDVQRQVDDYVAALWCQIQTYPLARRPHRIPANLALDTLKALHREHRWLVRGEVVLWRPEAFTDEEFDAVLSQRTAGWSDDAGTQARAVLAAGRSLSLINDRSHAVLHTIYIDGLTGEAAAARHGMNVGTIRVQCWRAVQRLANHASALRDAA
jgi:DNA-directed RNA polymerase specialized sigma24 family protein